MKPKVLLLEDDELISLTLTHFLSQRGYEVNAFSEPKACLLYLDNSCHCNSMYPCTDVIITDINMPGISGIKFVENQIKRGCVVENIAVMSASWSGGEIEKAERIGCKVFTKPFDLKDLKEWLEVVEKKIHPERKLSEDIRFSSQ